MLNVNPCPYCGGEVEVVRLANKGRERMYRIQCYKCHALVARGKKFEKETTEQGEERIKQYEAVMENKYAKALY